MEREEKAKEEKVGKEVLGVLVQVETEKEMEMGVETGRVEKAVEGQVEQLGRG